MEYTILKLADLAGVSTRTLRYYDEIGLLKPSRINSSGYRIYTENEVNLLQQILCYREIGIELSEIKKIMLDEDYNVLNALKDHLNIMEGRQSLLKQQIKTIKKTINSLETNVPIPDSEKFEGFRQQFIEENERRYGKEARRKYGSEAVESSSAKIMSLSPQDYKKMQKLESEILSSLEKAVLSGADPKGPEGIRIAKMHKEWLSFSWLVYIKEAHSGVVQMYTEDERFIKYYDRNVKGCAAFLREAVLSWLAS